MTLNDIADQIEEEWYGSPKLHDFHSTQKNDPQHVDTIEHKTEGK